MLHIGQLLKLEEARRNELLKLEDARRNELLKLEEARRNELNQRHDQLQAKLQAKYDQLQAKHDQIQAKHDQLQQELSATKFDAVSVTQRAHVEKLMREAKRRVIAAKVGQVDGDIQSRMRRARTMTDVNSAVVDGWHLGVKALLFSDCSCKPDIPRVSAHHGYLYGHLSDGTHHPLRPVLYVLEDDDDLSFWSYVAQMFRSKAELINPVVANAGLLQDFAKANGK